MTRQFLLKLKSRIFCNCDKKSMLFGKLTFVLRTHFKEVLDLLFTYSSMKKDDMIPACEI